MILRNNSRKRMFESLTKGSKLSKYFHSSRLNESRQLNEGNYYKGDDADLQALFDAVANAASSVFTKSEATLTYDSEMNFVASIVTENSKLMKAVDSLCNELVDEDNQVNYEGKIGSCIETKTGCEVKIGKKGDIVITVDARSHVAVVKVAVKFPKKGILIPGKFLI